MFFCGIKAEIETKGEQVLVLSNFIWALAWILDLVLNIYMWIIVVRALISWVHPDPYNPLVRFLYNVTEPVLGWLRRKLPLVWGGIDLSPLAVILLIYFIRLFLIKTLFDLALQTAF